LLKKVVAAVVAFVVAMRLDLGGVDKDAEEVMVVVAAVVPSLVVRLVLVWRQLAVPSLV